MFTKNASLRFIHAAGIDMKWHWLGNSLMISIWDSELRCYREQAVGECFEGSPSEFLRASLYRLALDCSADARRAARERWGGL